jgi:tetratricopeptide (TPR) repeat protein
MHALIPAFFAVAFAAQVSAQAPQPQWLTELQAIQREMYQSPLGTLDNKVDLAWRAALETGPRDWRFQMAAQIVSNFYQSQGYDLKAEQALRQAIAAVPQDDAQMRRNLTSQLAGVFECTGQLVKALAIREELAKLPPPTATPSYEAAALANLYERMGEIGKAEAAWKEVAAQRAAEAAARTSDPRFASAPFQQNELANFYAHHGRAAEAEELYKKALAEAPQGRSPLVWDPAEEGYLNFLSEQRRFDEAAGLIRKSIQALEDSPDPQAAQALFAKRQRLVSIWRQAGRRDDALAMQKQAVEAARPGSLEYVHALASLAQMLAGENRLEEAEQAVAEMRGTPAGNANGAKFQEATALQTLARIRDMQNRPEEARRLRASAGMVNGAGRNQTTLWDVVGPAQQEAFRGNVDAAAASMDKALALAAERITTNPQEITALTKMALLLKSRQREEEAQRIANVMVSLFDQAPDHPHVASALGSLSQLLAQLGMAAEADRLIERQEAILIRAKGAEAVALNEAGSGRIALMQHEQNWEGIAGERKRMLARMEKAAGPKSQDSMWLLRELAWSYQPLNNWPEEEGVFSMLLERTINFYGRSNVETAHVLQQMANRASENREYEKALGWIDQGIEAARATPDIALLQSLTQNREQILRAKDAPAASLKWFNGSSCVQGTGGLGVVKR